MTWRPRTFAGVNYVDPREELRGRATLAENLGDTYASIPIDLIEACLNVRECESRTTINGDRFDKVLIEVKCTRLVDPVTRKHGGLHINGRSTW